MGRAQNRVLAILTLATMGLVMWETLPAADRALMAASARQAARRALAAAARLAGHRAMGDELEGRAPQAQAGYRLTYRLSRLRDLAGRGYAAGR